ncbi:Clp protease N-terminal domain-containing protein [Actinomycetospora sp. CA-101289]|uniref:Clp protease N-terminal domain-containing protein n=1 Tax=Actinomycetospora sp. CA-101289 TaxID=3239893 RepID=UPI003D96CA8D
MRHRGKDACAWPGWVRAAGLAGAQGRERAGTEHLLLALADGPAGPAREALTSAGLVLGVVRRALAAIAGPDSAPSKPLPLDGVVPGDRARVILGRAVVLAEGRRVGIGQPSTAAGAATPDDVDVLLALVTSAEPGLARLVLEQHEAVDAIERSLLDQTGRHSAT